MKGRTVPEAEGAGTGKERPRPLTLSTTEMASPLYRGIPKAGPVPKSRPRRPSRP